MIARAIIAVLCIVATYLAHGFVKADFNAWNWSEQVRASCVFFALAAIIVTMIGYSDWDRYRG